MNTFSAKGLARLAGVGLALLAAVAPPHAGAVGTWTPLANKLTQTATSGHMLLLTDGTVMVQDNGRTNWTYLKPDNQGHYVNGQWSAAAPMLDSRAFYASQVLTDGRVFVAGGEYGAAGVLTPASGARAEIFDPVANTWTQINPPTSLLDYTVNSPVGSDNGLQAFYDCESILLPDGTVLLAPVNPATLNGTLIYNPFLNTWTNGPPTVNNPQGNQSQAEATWVKLADESILTIDPALSNAAGTNTERYIPSLGQWVVDAPTPLAIYNVIPGSYGEIGAAFLLPTGKAFFLGGSSHTAYYSPGGSANKGTWIPGPDMPGGLAAADAPAAMLVNGKILCELAFANNRATNYFYEYDPVAQTFTQLVSPTGGSTNINNISDRTYMLALPDGTVLYSDSTQQLYVYTPDSPPLASGKPAIQSVVWNSNGTLHLGGTGFNGISSGAAYGDEAQEDSNYPLVRFTDGSGNVNYGRTYNWSSTGVQTGSRFVTTECALPGNVFVGPGAYTIQVVANGIASDPVGLPGPIWVDFSFTGSPQVGTFANPFPSLAQGVTAVAPAAEIFIKPGLSHETMTITKPMFITTIGGAATIGH